MKPEEPIFTRDKTPPTPGAEEEVRRGVGRVGRAGGRGAHSEGDLKFSKAAKGALCPQINPAYSSP